MGRTRADAGRGRSLARLWALIARNSRCVPRAFHGGDHLLDGSGAAGVESHDGRLGRVVNLDIRHLRQRLLVRPGITGLAQTHGNTQMSWDERILYDIAYVRRCNLTLDLFILARTAVVIVVGEPVISQPFKKSRCAEWVAIPDSFTV